MALSLFLSLSTSSLVLHHIIKPALVASRCCSLLLFDLHLLHLLHHSTCLTFAINQSINPSINHLGEGFDATCLSLSLLNEGIVVSERERERERETARMLWCCCCCSLASRECVRVCYDTANSLSIVTRPTKHTMCVCVCVTLTLSALVEGRPCLVSKCAQTQLFTQAPPTTTTTTIPTQPSSSCSCSMIAREFFHHTHTSLALSLSYSHLCSSIRRD